MIFFELRWAFSNTVVCFNSLVYSVRVDYRNESLSSDSFRGLLLPYATDISRRCNGTAEGQSWWCWVGGMAIMYVGRFLSANIDSNALPKWRSLPVRKLCSSRWQSANYLSPRQQKCRNQAVLLSRNLLLLLGLLGGRFKGEWDLCAAHISKIPLMSCRNNKKIVSDSLIALFFAVHTKKSLKGIVYCRWGIA